MEYTVLYARIYQIVYSCGVDCEVAHQAATTELTATIVQVLWQIESLPMSDGLRGLGSICAVFEPDDGVTSSRSNKDKAGEV
jgi:hypothetical protein